MQLMLTLQVYADIRVCEFDRMCPCEKDGVVCAHEAPAKDVLHTLL